MASPNQDMGPVAALLNLVDQTTVAIWVVVVAPLIAFGRWVWGVRKKDLERMSNTERGVATALERIAALQTDPGHHVVQQGWSVRSGPWSHRWVGALSDQTFHQR